MHLNRSLVNILQQEVFPGLSDGKSLNISSEKPERKFLAIVVSLNNHSRHSTLESCGQLPLEASYFFDNCLVFLVTYITGRP